MLVRTQGAPGPTVRNPSRVPWALSQLRPLGGGAGRKGRAAAGGRSPPSLAPPSYPQDSPQAPALGPEEARDPRVANFRACCNHLDISLKGRFYFSMSGAEPEILHCKQVPGGAAAVNPWTILRAAASEIVCLRAVGKAEGPERSSHSSVATQRAAPDGRKRAPAIALDISPFGQPE